MYSSKQAVEMNTIRDADLEMKKFRLWEIRSEITDQGHMAGQWKV